MGHIPPINAKPMPVANNMSGIVVGSVANDFSPGIRVTSPSVLRSDTQVVRTSFENPISAPPFGGGIKQPSASDLPWSYELQNLSYAQFEAKLSSIWGRRLMGKSLDTEQKNLRIYLPEGKSSPEQTMRFDRVNRIATFEGSPSRKSAWHELMQALDRVENSPASQR